MKYFSTFSGIGGFELGINSAMPDAVCVGFSEVNKYASAIYQHHFPTHHNYGDITKITAEELPDFDMLVGGFPCQAFSIAGKRKGFEDTRGTLFFDVARILRAKRPRLFVLENVKGLLSHDNGRTFSTIIATIDELGYDCQWQVLNSKNHGVPQNRERVYIVGHLRGTSRPEVFPIGDNSRSTDGLSGQCTNTLTARYYGGQANGMYVTESEQHAQIVQLNHPKHSNDRVYDTKGISPTLNTMQGGNRQPFVAMTEKRTEEAKAIRKETKGRDFSPRRGKYLTERSDGVGNCLTSCQSKEALLTDGLRIRRLTPKECERLQGFRDNWTNVCNTSDSQRYKCLGNAVTVNVVRDIMKHL